MKITKSNLTAIAAATSIALGSAFAPSMASADTSATVGAASMYLWRGLNLTPSGAQVSGSLDYSNGGFYAGVWTSTETDGHETDLYLGYGGEVGGFSYDISYWKYLYPEDCTAPPAALSCDMGDNDASEYVLSLGYGPVSLGYYMAAESGADDDKYITLGVDFGKFNLTYGMWDFEFPGNEYTHLTLSYAATDELTFAVSVASNDSGYDQNAGDPDAVEEDPLFMVSYSKTFDLK